MDKHVVIIGNGIAGTTCARHLRKQSDCRITILSEETEYFFSRTALMYIYMGHMKFEHTKPYEDNFWKKNRIGLMQAKVIKIDANQKQIHFSEGSPLAYDQLIIATGSKPNRLGRPGQHLGGVQSLYHLQDLQLMEKSTRNISHAVVVGGGLIGIEMAEMLHSRNIGVTFLVREENFWDNVLPREEAEMINRHIRDHGIDLRLATELKEIKGSVNGHCSSVITSHADEIACGFVGLTVGVSPNIGIAAASGIESDRGILVNDYFETSVTDIYSIGDCAQLRTPKEGRRPIEAVWYAGRMHGETLAATLSGSRTAFQPGHWFNSAKFFDIEYQTYGLVPPKNAPGESSFYWAHRSGKMSFRAAYSLADWQLKGINVFGIRMRHDVIDCWLSEKRTIDYIIDHLREANFDPEFSSSFENEIRTKYVAERSPSNTVQ